MAAEMGQAAVDDKSNFIEKYKAEAKLANQEKSAYSQEIKHLKSEISRVKKINQSLARADVSNLVHINGTIYKCISVAYNQFFPCRVDSTRLELLEGMKK